MSDRIVHEGMFIPYLIVAGAKKAIDFYTQAFDATVVGVLEMPGGLVAHAEISIDGRPIYLADQTPDMEDGPIRAPSAVGSSGVILTRYVEDVDAAYERATAAGGSGLQPPQDQFYGDRSASVGDPFGHQWSLMSHLREVSYEEMAEQMAEMG